MWSKKPPQKTLYDLMLELVDLNIQLNASEDDEEIEQIGKRVEEIRETIRISYGEETNNETNKTRSKSTKGGTTIH